jgi:predicted amidophosphoribosyltransferase
MEPIYYGTDTETGEPIGVFAPDQWERIKAGYACPRCWQEFSMIFTKCPVCQLDLTQNLDPQIREYPAEWTPNEEQTKRPLT